MSLLDYYLILHRLSWSVPCSLDSFSLSTSLNERAIRDHIHHPGKWRSVTGNFKKNGNPNQLAELLTKEGNILYSGLLSSLVTYSSLILFVKVSSKGNKDVWWGK